jgi:hypothetical protein
MEKFYLPKGTIVKHGTSLCRLRSILSNGIIPHSNQNEKRMQFELPPETHGIYIGELTAYFGAIVSYTSILNPYTKLESFASALKCIIENPCGIKKLILSEIPATLPVVLNIELQEDCLVLADEDYVFDGEYPDNEKIPDEILISEAGKVWDKWKSGCIVREEGIPKSWIKHIEYPRISSLGGNNALHKDTWADIELMAAATMQSSLRYPPEKLLKSFENKHKRRTLSQRTNASHKHLDNIYELNGLSDTFNLYYNHIIIIMTFERMAQEYCIPLHR